MTIPAATLQERTGYQPHVREWGAIPDMVEVSDASISATSHTLTLGVPAFKVNRVGQFIAVAGAGPAGADLITTIVSFTTETEVELAAAAATTVSGVRAVWGRNNTLALQTAIDECASHGVLLRLHFGAYLTGPLTIPSSLHLIGSGRGMSRLVCLPGSVSVDTPWLVNSDTDSGNSDITIEHLTLDGARLWQGSATGADLLRLENVTRFSALHCSFENAVLRCIGGWDWSEVLIEGCRFAAWLPGNVIPTSETIAGLAGFGGAVQCCAEYGAAESRHISVANCHFDGTETKSTCLKFSGSATYPVREVAVHHNTVLVGAAIAADLDTLGIEFWSPDSDPIGFKDFTISSNLVRGEDDLDGKIFGISVAGSGGTHGSIASNIVEHCHLYGIEIASSSNLSIVGNTIKNSAGILFDSNFGACQHCTITGNVIHKPTKSSAWGSNVYGIKLYAGVLGGNGPHSITHIVIANNSVDLTDSGADYPTAIELQCNHSTALISDVQVINNNILGDGSVVQRGITIANNASGTLERNFVAGNLLSGLEQGIHVGAGDCEYNRYFANFFSANVATHYEGTLGAGDDIVDINSAEGAAFAPTSLQIRGSLAPEISSDGSIRLTNPNSLAHIANGIPDASSEAYPNLVVLNKVNYGTELQGGIISVNSIFDGHPNWRQSTAAVWSKALYVILGAGRFAVGFDDAANANGANVGDPYAFSVDQSDGIFRTGSGSPIYPMDRDIGIYTRTGAEGSPEGSLSANPGSVCIAPSAVYRKESGTGTTGWIQLGVIADLGDASKIDGTGLTSGRVLGWDGSKVVNGEVDVNDANDVAATGFSTNQYAQWDGTRFVGNTPSGGATDLGNSADVDGTGLTSGKQLQWDGAKVVNATAGDFDSLDVGGGDMTVDASGNTDVNSLEVGGTTRLDSSGRFFPVVTAQSSEPTLQNGELRVWENTTTGIFHLVYRSALGAQWKVALG